MPEANERLAAQAVAVVQGLRGLELYKVPGVSETLDWVAALAVLDRTALDPDAVEQTLGVVLKAREDIDAVRGAPLAALLERAAAR
jgi:MoxR-like ATPase